jgi:hypothetical protein
MEDQIQTIGNIKITVEYDDGKKIYVPVKNKVLRSGRMALASGLANQTGGTFEFYISSMLFGSGGTSGGTPRFVDDTRAGLFGATILTKGVISSIDPNMPTQVIFTSVITFDEIVGQIVNEMAMQMKNGDLYAMATFGDISKTSSMQLTFNWSQVYV